MSPTMIPHTPKTRLRPTEIAPDTYLIHNHQGEGTAPVSVALNSMVIRGAEPVVVDTGAAEHREHFFHDLFGLVDPEDIRWVFISHDDIDHTGNLNELMELAPRATLVINWFMTERLGESLRVHPGRWRWIGDGDSLDVGDRTLYTVRPPIFDSPTSRGIYDPKSQIYWASDSFAAPMPTPVRRLTEVDREVWTEGMVTFNHYISPWLSLVDDVRYQRTVDRVAALRPSGIAACHAPFIDRELVDDVIRITRETPAAPFPPEPDQTLLDEIQRTLGPAATPCGVPA